MQRRGQALALSRLGIVRPEGLTPSVMEHLQTPAILAIKYIKKQLTLEATAEPP